MVNKAFFVALMTVLCLSFIGCNKTSESSANTSVAGTATSTRRQATPEVRDNEIVIVTPIGTKADIISVSPNGEYTIAVSYAQEASPPNAEDRFVVVVATLANESNTPITINPTDLTLIDKENNRYSPEPPESNLQPALIGIALSPNETIYGFVKFKIPPEAAPTLLEWCPGGTCTEPIQSSVTMAQ